MVVRRCAVCRGLAGHRQAVLTCKQPLGWGESATWRCWDGNWLGDWKWWWGERTMVGSENGCRIETFVGYGRSDGIEDECGYWKRLLGLTRIWGRTLMVNLVPSCDSVLIYRQLSFRVRDKLQAQGWKKYVCESRRDNFVEAPGWTSVASW